MRLLIPLFDQSCHRLVQLALRQTVEELCGTNHGHDGRISRCVPASVLRVPVTLTDSFLITCAVAGASKTEVGIMGTLTANLHLLMCSFYRPTKQRYKILFESKAFPSDNYAFASQAEMHGYDKKDALVRVAPRQGEYCLRTEDILKTIEDQGDEGEASSIRALHHHAG